MNEPSLFEQAFLLHRQGRLQEAEPLYRQFLESEPGAFPAQYQFALLRHQQGDRDDALAAIKAALQTDPGAVPALMLEGILLREMGRREEALASFTAAAAAKPDLAEAWYNRGVVLMSLARHQEALASFDAALVLRPAFAEAWNNRGIALRDLKRPNEALASFEQALAIRPEYAGALYNRGVTLWETRQGDAARVSLLGALAFRPDHAEAWNCLGLVLRDLKRPGEALESAERALRIAPAFTEAWTNRGSILADLKRFEEALASHDWALTINPDYAEAWNNRANTLRRLDRSAEAKESYERALAINPDFASALHNRGDMALRDRLFEPARGDLERAAAIAPERDYLLGDLLNLRMQVGDWRDFAEQVARIDEGVRAGRHIVQPFIYQAISGSPVDLKACSVLFAERHYPAAAPRWRARSEPHAKIRVGYLSGEFYQQPTAYLTAELYERHDKSQFEIVAFDNGASDGSSLRKRLEQAFDRVVDISKLSDSAAAEAIAGAGIDILVNLNGYFGEQRMGVFAERPAPIQVNYLGFPATLGADYIDYILADRCVIPEEERQFYVEQVVWLPDSYQANDLKRAIAEAVPSRAECGLPETGFVFCNFNQSYKLAPESFAPWMRILKQVPGAVLWQLECNAWFPGALRREAEAQGVTGERLIFAAGLPLDRHLARLKRADLFLDGLPYNAHTTASDALWAGLPLVTCRGSAFPGRVAASLLAAVGLPELIAENWDEYELLAVGLARDPVALAGVRERLARNRRTTPLFDAARFTHHIESAYVTMWDIFRCGERPRSFAVAVQK